MHLVKTIRYPQEAETWKRPEKIWLTDGRMEGYRAHELVLMMEGPYTDKHGRPLFEHDVVRWDGGELLEVQRWERTGWKFVPPADPENFSFLIAEDSVNLELVGNIFQQPALLRVARGSPPHGQAQNSR
jgi:hypothetical protein